MIRPGESRQHQLLRDAWTTDVVKAYMEIEILKAADARPLFLGGHFNQTGCMNCQQVVLGGAQIGDHSCGTPSRLLESGYAIEPYLIGDGMWDIFPEGSPYIEYVQENGGADDECVFLANIIAHVLLENYKPEYLYTIKRIMEVNVNGL